MNNEFNHLNNNDSNNVQSNSNTFVPSSFSNVVNSNVVENNNVNMSMQSGINNNIQMNTNTFSNSNVNANNMFNNNGMNNQVSISSENNFNNSVYKSNMDSNNYNQNVNMNVNHNNNFSMGGNINNSNEQKGNNKKFIMFVAIVIALIVIGFVVYRLFFRSKISNEKLYEVTFDEDQPIVIKEKEKYGVISSDGKVIIEPTYHYIDEFHGGYSYVSRKEIDEYDDETYLYKIIDKKGNFVFEEETFGPPEYIEECGLWEYEGKLFDANFKQLTSDDLLISHLFEDYFEFNDYTNYEAGIMKVDKKIFTYPSTYLYIDISESNYTDDLYANVSIKDPENPKELVVSLKTGDILYENSESGKIIHAKKNGVFYYYDDKKDESGTLKKFLFFANNKLLYESNENINDLSLYDLNNLILEVDYGYNYKKLGKEQSKYYYDIKNKKMLKEIPENSEIFNKLNLFEFTYNYEIFYESHKYGLKHEDNIVIPAEYDDIEFMDINLYEFMSTKGKKIVYLEKEDDVILYDLSKSSPIVSFKADYVQDYSDSSFIQFIIYDDYRISEYIVYNLLSGMQLSFDKDTKLTIGSNYIIASREGKSTYYNTDCKQIYVVNG